MNTPKELKYSKSHEWVKVVSDELCEVGLTDFAQSSLGDLVFVNLPEVDSEVNQDEVVCDVESVKAVSDVFCPLNGIVCEINEELLDHPEKINEDPYGAWLFKLKNYSGLEDLLDDVAYEEVCANEEH